MGMYNVIKSKTKCPICNKPVEWQSKHLTYDGYVLADLLENIRLNEHMSGEMHAYCDNCDTAVEITIKNGKEGTIKPRKMTKKDIVLPAKDN